MDLIFSNFDLATIIYVSLLVVSGAIVQTISGFGFGIFVMILLPFFMPSYSSALALSTLLSATISTSISIKQRKYIQYKTAAIPIIAYMVIATFAVRFSIIGSEGTLKGFLGLLLIALSIYFMKFASSIKIQPSIKNGFIAGAVSGLLSGLFGMGGPPMVLYFLSCTANTISYLATIQFFFSVSTGYNSLVRILNGSFTPFLVFMWGVSLISLFIGNKIGNILISKVNDKTLRNLVYIFMGVSGCLISITSLLNA